MTPHRTRVWTLKTPHSHCWHPTTGPLMIDLKDGYVHQTCCECPETRVVHRDHQHEPDKLEVMEAQMTRTCEGCGAPARDNDTLCENCDAVCPCFTMTHGKMIWCPVHEREWNSSTAMIRFVPDMTQ